MAHYLSMENISRALVLVCGLLSLFMLTISIASANAAAQGEGAIAIIIAGVSGYFAAMFLILSAAHHSLREVV